MKTNLFTRMLSTFLAALMLFGAMPIGVFAEDADAAIETAEDAIAAPVTEITDDAAEEEPALEILGAEESVSENPYADADYDSISLLGLGETDAEDEGLIGDSIITEDGFRLGMNASGTSYSILGYLGAERAPKIPSEYLGLPVTRIRNNAFRNKTSIVKIVLPDSIIRIDEGVFDGCSEQIYTIIDGGKYIASESNEAFYFAGPADVNATSCTVHDGTVLVGSRSFSACANLKEVVIPDSVQQIGYGALMFCDAIESVTLPFVGATGTDSGNTHFGFIFGARTIGGNIFYMPDSLKTVVITGGAYIAKGAFYGVDMIENITLPYLGGTLGNEENAFLSYYWGADSYEQNIVPQALRTVTINGGRLADYAFYGCTKLSAIDLHEISYFGSYVVEGCTAKVSCFSTCENVVIQSNAFYNCSTLLSIVIGADAQIGEKAFYNCTGLKTVAFLADVASIGTEAFEGCSALDALYISDLAAWCAIDFPYTQKSVGMFQYEYYATSNPLNYANEVYIDGEKTDFFVIPEGVTSIGNYAFWGCKSMVGVSIPKSMQKLGMQAFEGCASLEEVYISDITAWVNIDFAVLRGFMGGIAGISSNPLSLASRIYIDGILTTEIVIPEGVTSIGNYAFCSCKGMTSITIPSSVTNIGLDAFAYCNSLKEVHISDIAAWCNIDFVYSNSVLAASTGSQPLLYAKTLYLQGEIVENLVIPEGCTRIRDYAFYGCESITSVTIPRSITHIGDEAFSLCTNLVTIYNKSSLLFECGSRAYGDIAYYANKVYNGNPITTEDGFVFVKSAVGYQLVEYTGGEETITLPFDYNGETYSIYCFRGARNIILPEGITAINNYAFYNCAGLVSITIPLSVTDIGEFAFAGCTGLENVVLADGITSIGSSAFFNCVGLKSIQIPLNMESIGASAFEGCSSLSNVYNNSSLNLSFGSTENGYVAYYADVLTDSTGAKTYKYGDYFELEKGFLVFENASGGYTLAKYIGTEESITVPIGIVNIEANAFSDCTSVKSIVIPDTVIEIKEYAFDGCSCLESVVCLAADSSIETTIGAYAFRNCTLLKNVELPNTLTHLNSYLFYGCSNLLNITIPDGITGIGTYAFSGCTSLAGVTIPATMKSIGSNAFEGCSNLHFVYNNSALAFTMGDSGYGNIAYNAKLLTDANGTITYTGDTILNSLEWQEDFVLGTTDAGTVLVQYRGVQKNVIVPSGVTDIGVYAFSGCINVESVSISESVTIIGNCAFYNCNNLKSLEIPSNVTSIGYSAFAGCSNMKSIVLPDTITAIPVSCFRECISLETIHIPSNVTHIAGDAFYRCSGLKNLSIPDGVTMLEGYTFYGCSGLESIVLPVGIARIGSCEFYGCESLKSIIIPETVTSIGNNAFYRCFALQSITLPSALQSIGNNAFWQCSSLKSIVFPQKLKSIGDGAFAFCAGLTSVTIPASLERIGESAFDNCSALERVYLADLASWCGIEFVVSSVYGPSNPLKDAEELYVNGRLVTDISLPEGLTEISNCAFYGFEGIKKVTMPSTMNRIGSQAFANCTNLQNVDFGEGVTDIGHNAFKNCIGLKNVEIPDCVTQIGAMAFMGCENLLTVDFPEGITTLSNDLFNKCGKLSNVDLPNTIEQIGSGTFAYCTSLSRITIPASVTSISSSAFSACENLVAVFNNSSLVFDIGSSEYGSVAYYARVLVQGGDAFCSSVYEKTEDSFLFEKTENGYMLMAYFGSEETVTLPDSCNEQSYSIWSMNGAKHISLPASIRGFEEHAFINCPSLESLTFLGDRNEWRFIEKASDWDEGLGDYSLIFAKESEAVYESNIDLTELYISSYHGQRGIVDASAVVAGRPVTAVYERAFYGCETVKTITLPETIASIGTQAFNGCTNLESITIPDSVETMEFDVFGGCTSLVTVVLPFLGLSREADETSYLGYYFGAYSTSENGAMVPDTLENVTVTDITAVIDKAFVDCGSIVSLSIPEGVTSIGEYAFSDCTSLASFVFPDSVSTVGKMLFERCNSLKTITIGASLGEIPDKKDGNPLFGISKSSSSLTQYIVSEENSEYRTDASGVLYRTMTIPYTDGDRRIEVSVVDAPAKANLADYAFPSHIVEIEPYAFAHNATLRAVNLEYIRLIANHAFYGATGLVSVTFGEPIEYDSEFLDFIVTLEYSQYVGDCAFMGCTALQKVNFETPMLIGIGEQAFYDCTELKTVIFSEKIQSIGASAFGTSGANESNLEQFAVHADNPHYTSVGGVLYAINEDETLTLLLYPGASPIFDKKINEDGSVTLTPVWDTEKGEVVRNISFALPTVADDGVTPVAVSAIDSYAFTDARYLHFADLQPQIEMTLGDYVFSGASIQGVTIGANVTSLGLNRGEGEYTVFADCSMLETIDVDAGNEYYSSADGVLFNKNRTRLIKYPAAKVGDAYIVPETVNMIASMAFKNNPSLRSVSISSYIASLGLEAFYNCPKLAVIFFEGVYAPITIMENAFETYCDPETIIGYSEAYYFDGNGVSDYGWQNYSGAYDLRAMSELPELSESESQGYYAIVVVDEEGNRMQPALDEEGNSIENLLVTLTDPNGVSETVPVGVDENGNSDGVATFYDLFGAVGMGFAIDYDEPYSLRVADTSGVYYTYVADKFYLDHDMRITYVTLVKRPLTVTFHGNGAEGSAPTVDCTVGDAVSLPTASGTEQADFYRPGYTFKGWSTLEEGAEAYIDTFHINAYRDNYLLYAIWEANEYTISFNTNVAADDKFPVAGTMGDIKTHTDEEFLLPATGFTRDGFIFIGWATESDGAVIYSDGAEYVAGPQNVGAKVTLYAAWEVKTNKLVYHPNSGEGSMDSVEIKTTDTITLNKNTFTRPGYTFKGWATAPDGAVAYADQSSYSSTVADVQVLYAVWEANINEIRFYGNKGDSSVTTLRSATDSTIQLPSDAFSRSGYWFQGWATSANGPVVYDGGAAYKVGPAESVSFYAVWAKSAVIYGVRYNETDINTQTVKLNKKMFGTVCETISLKDPNKGFTLDNIQLYGEKPETIEVVVIGYYDPAFYSLVENGCMLYQNGKAIQDCVVTNTDISGDSVLVTFELPVVSLAAEVPIEARFAISGTKGVVTSTTFLNIDVIDFTVNESEVEFDFSELTVDLSSAGKMFSMLMGSSNFKVNLGKNVKFAKSIEDDTVTLSLNGDVYNYSKSKKSSYSGNDYKKGYEDNHEKHNKNTWFFQKKAQVKDKNGKTHTYTYNIRFANETANENYYYYRCYIYEGKYENNKATFYGGVYAYGGRAGVAMKAAYIHLVHSMTAKDNKDIAKGDQYTERRISFEKSKSTNHSFSVDVYGDFVFRYDADRKFVPVSSQVKGHIHYSFKHNQQFVVVIIPVTLEITVDIDGTLVCKWNLDKEADLPPVEASLKLSAEISARLGIGCSVLSAGVYGQIATVFVLEFAPDFGVESWHISGRIAAYVRYMTLKWKKVGWFGYFTFQTEEKQQTIYEKSGYIIDNRDKMSLLGVDTPVLESMYLQDTYTAAENTDELYEKAELFTHGHNLYKVYYTKVMDGDEYDTYNYMKLAVSKWNAAASVWSEPVLVEDNGNNDFDFMLYDRGKKRMLVYTQQTEKTTAETAENSYSYVSDLAVKVMDLSDPENMSEPILLADNAYYKYYARFGMVGGTPVIVWAENADNNMFGVSPENYVDATGASHVFPTTANSVWMSQYTGNAWSTPICVSSGLAPITDLEITDGGYIAYVLDTDCDLSTAADQTLYYAVVGTTAWIAYNESASVSIHAAEPYADGILYRYTELSDEGLSESGLAYTAFGRNESFDLLPEDTSLITDDYTYLQNADGEITAILYSQSKTWYDEDGEKLDGAALYGIFKDGENWGSPVEIESPMIAAESGQYILSYDVLTDPADAKNLWITAEYFDGATKELTAKTDKYTLDSDISLDSYSVDYAVQTLTVQFTNRGAEAADVLVSVNEEGETVCLSGLLPGATGECTLPLMGYGMTPAVCFVDGHNGEGIASLSDLDLHYADLQVNTKPLLLGDRNILLVSVSNLGNMASAGTLYVKLGNHTAETVRENSYSLPVDTVLPGAIRYYEILLTDELSVGENSLATVYVAESAGMEKQNTENNFTQTNLQEFSSDVADDGSSYAPQAGNRFLQFDPFAAEDITVQYSVESGNALTAIRLDGTALTETAQYYVVNTEATGYAVLFAEYLQTVSAGEHTVELVFSDQTTLSLPLEVFAYYTVSWYDDAGHLLQAPVQVRENTIPVYEGTPVKAEDTYYTYTFVGWDMDGDGVADKLSAVTEDREYAAVFTAVKKLFTVTWIVDGKRMEEEYPYETTPAYNGKLTKLSDAQYSYTFVGWLPSVKAVRADAAYTAIYTATKHTFGDWEIRYGSTCSASGERYRTCTNCGYEETELIEGQHTFGEWQPYDSVQHFKMCICGEIEYAAHIFASGASESTATCTEDGFISFACTDCPYVLQMESPALGHDIVQHVAQDPTCVAVGWHAYETCTRCDHTTYEELPELGHVFVNNFCTRCGDTYTMLGDVNRDSALTIVDALLILKSILNEQVLENADVSCDGKVSLADVFRLMKKITALEQSICHVRCYDGNFIFSNSVSGAYNSSVQIGDIPMEKVGYTFKGWYLDPDCIREAPDTLVLGSPYATDVDGELTVMLWGVWEPNPYTVLYDANGGSGTTVASSHVYDSESALSANGFTREHYSFIGWSPEADATVSVYAEQQIVKNLAESGSATLYAVWLPDAYTVTVDANGGIASAESIPVSYMLPYGTLPEAERTGYTFAGWYSASEGGDLVTAETVVTYPNDHTIYAHWEPEVYTVSLEANGGSVALHEKTVVYLQVYGDLPTPTRTGYTFAGWYTSASGGTAVTAESEVVATADHTIYAYWTANTYTVTYNANGGSGTTAASTHTYDSESALATNGFSRTGYSFVGWSTEASSMDSSYSEGQLIQNLATGGSVVLYAVWSANTYTVTYDANGGSVNTAGKTVTYDSVYGALPTPTRTGYAFAGWTLNGSAVTATVTVTTAEDHALVARWTPNTYTVTYNANGGSGTTAASTHTYDAESALTVNGFTRAGYTFIGWSADPAATVSSYSDQQKVQNLAASGSITLYAVWEAGTFAVALDANGGSVAPSGKAVVYLQTYGTLPTPTRTGYAFVGWYTAASGGTAVTAESKVVATADHTIYAQWTANTYAVTYDANGGSGTTVASTHTYDAEKALTVNGFTRTGYTFAGWSESAGATASYSDGQNVKNLAASGSVTLYAVWRANTYTVTYDANGGSGVTSTTVTYASAYGALATPTRTGYTFAGWKLNGSVVTATTTVTTAADHTLVAQWTANTYTVTYNANGGSVSTASKTVTYGAAYGVLTTPTRTGYTFAGWTLNSSAVTATTTVVTAANHTLVASWTANTYIVTFGANGGSVSTASKTVTYGAAYGVLTTPTRTGYTFAGWTLNNSAVTATTTVATAENHTLVASWTANTYTVTYNANGGSVSPASKTVTYGTTYGALATPTRTGYTFAGWKLNGSAVTATTTVATAETHTLVASWTANTYIVTFGANGGSVSTASKTVTYDSAYGTLPTPTRTGYTFAGWYTAASGGTKVTASTTVTIASNHTLYAHWTANTYTVTFGANGGSVSTASKTVTYDSAYGTLPTPTRTGYTFAGWYTAASGGTKVTASTMVTTASNHTLYAHWTANTYTVAYNANGGSGTTATSSHTYGIAKTLTANGFSRSNYIFIGWSTSSSATTPTYTNGQSVQNLTATAGGTVTLYAVWLKISGSAGYYSRDLEIVEGSTGRVEYYNVGLNREALRAQGYTTIQLNMSVHGYENWLFLEPWPIIKVYNRYGTVVAEENNKNKSWASSWEVRNYTYTVSIDVLQDDGQIKVGYYAANEIWHLGTAEVTATAKK